MLRSIPYLFASQVWFATVQEVLQADWQEVWHLPQPPFAAVSFRFALFTVLMCFIIVLPFKVILYMYYIINGRVLQYP